MDRSRDFASNNFPLSGIHRNEVRHDTVCLERTAAKASIASRDRDGPGASQETHDEHRPEWKAATPADGFGGGSFSAKSRLQRCEWPW